MKMNTQESFNTIKKVVDLALQNGVIKTIEESKIVYDSLETLYKEITKEKESEKSFDISNK